MGGTLRKVVETLRSGAGLALLAAALFGASTPLAKVLLRDVDPWLLAGLLYLGSGAGLLVWRIAMSWVVPRARHAPLDRAKRGWLGLTVLFGGVIGPVLLMVGLSRTFAGSAALLLNLEGVLTALIAWVVFRENVDRRIALGMAAITAGAIILTWGEAPAMGHLMGPGAIVGACLAWAVDNNLTRKISEADPVLIAMIKGLIAGAVNTGIGLGVGGRWPAAEPLLGAGLVGAMGYGASLVLFVVALRHLGAARTGAYFSLAPFFGAILAMLVLSEPLSRQLGLGGVLMAVGVWLHLTERHAHEHAHEVLAHTHRHVHDEHHQHAHDGTDPPGEPHTHAHVHTVLRHTHAHFPDIHHRHRHG